MNRSLLLSSVALIAALTLPGCKRTAIPAPAPAPAQNNTNPLTPIGAQPATTDIRRGAERQVNQNELKQLATFYLSYDIENNRPPATVADFLTYLRNDPNFPRKMIEPVEKGIVIVVANVKPTAAQVIAFERDVFQKANNRLVAFGDGRVELMNDNDFQKVKPK